MDTNSGLLYTDISYPLISTENEITEKSITVSNYSILGLFTFGNASLEKAKQEGNIKKSHTLMLMTLLFLESIENIR